MDEDGNRLFLVSEAQLRLLFHRCINCGKECKATAERSKPEKTTAAVVSIYSLGVDIRVEQYCDNCSTQKWYSFPPSEAKFHRGNFVLTAATIFAGNTYEDLNGISKVLNWKIMSRMTFYRLSTAFIYDAIDEHYLKREGKLYEGIRNQQTKDPTTGLRLAMDGRFSRPGFTATYGLVTALDLDRGRIIACHLRKKNDADVKSSSDMETVGVKTVLKSLLSPCGNQPLDDDTVAAILNGEESEVSAALEASSAIVDEGAVIRVAAVATDDSTTVKKMMETNFPEIRHDGDPWHVLKAIKKKLDKLAEKASTREVGYWKKAIANYLWTCMRKCGGDGNLLLEQWKAIGYHSIGVHAWPKDKKFSTFKKCQHSQNYTPKKTAYLVKGSLAHQGVLAILNDPDLQRRIYRCRYFMQTSAVENFHNVLLKFVPKRLHFSDRAFAARTKLAVFDWEENYDRTPLVNAAGNMVFSMTVPASAKDWRLKRLRMEHSYKWAKELMDVAFTTAETASLEGKLTTDTRSVVPEKTLVSAFDRPNRLTMLEQDYRRRFGELDTDYETE